MARILISDGMEKSKIKDLIDLGHEVIDKKVEKDELLAMINDVDALIVRSRTKVTKDVIDEACKTKRLQVIIRAGIGLDNINVEYAKENGFKVFNTPNSSSNAVAELALAQIINVARFVHTANIEMRQGLWEKSKYQGVEIHGKTLGLIGFGRIAKTLAQKAYVLGMNVIYHDPFVKDGGYGYNWVELDDLYARADFISLHIPGGENNHHMLNDEAFAKMKDGVYLVDLARGGVVEEEALLRALDSGKVKACALDVFEEEPTKNSALLNSPSISITPHIGASTNEAQLKIGDEIIGIIKENF